MSERIQSRIENFEANKAAAEQNEFEDSLYGEAGATDFSDDAKKRLAEGDTYEQHLQSMSGREGQTEDEYYDAEVRNGELSASYLNDQHDQALAVNAEIDAAAAQAKAFEDKVQADPSVRRMQLLASDISKLAGTAVTSDNEARASQSYQDKQDKLEELLVKFNQDADAFSAEERDLITARIIDMTEAVSTVAAEQTPEEPSLLPNYTAEQIDSRLEGVRQAKEAAAEAESSEDEPTDPDASVEDDAEAESDGEQYDEQAQQERMAERLDAPLDADELEDIQTEAPIPTDGREPVEVEVQDGESLEEYEHRTGVDTEPLDAAGLEDIEGEEPEVRQSRRLRDRLNPNAMFHRLMAGNFQRRARKGADAESSQGGSVVDRLTAAKERRESDESRERSRKDKLALGLGILGVAAVGVGVIVAAKYGLDYQPGNGGGGNGGNGGGNGGGSGGGNRLNWNDFDPSARTVTNGEGWNQTFKEMGIPKSEWNDVLKSAGPKLEKLGEAYFDNTAGEYRISRPGQLSSDALRVIASSSRKNGVEL